MIPDDATPTGYIEVDGDYMAFWLPDGVDPDDLGLDWVPQ